jgi:AAA domain
VISSTQFAPHRGCVVVSGLPASGKSTVARALANALRLELLDKDDFLEALFDTRGVGDVGWRRQLSTAADAQFRRRAELSQGAVLTSWWKHPRSPSASGTPTDWLASLRGPRVEVHCRCSAAVAALRFLARARHPGHLDRRWTHAELLAAFEQQASFGPLCIGASLLVNTEVACDTGPLVARVVDALAADTHNRACTNPSPSA